PVHVSRAPRRRRAPFAESSFVSEALQMATKVGINGFGRIGRNIMRAALGSKDIDFVAVHDLTRAATLAHLLQYHSILRSLLAAYRASAERTWAVGGVFRGASLKGPAKARWNDLGVEAECRSTAIFTARDSAAKQLAGGA